MTASNISRVMDSCVTSGIEVSNYFREVTKMIETGKGARRPVERLALLEYAVQSRNKELLEKKQSPPHCVPATMRWDSFVCTYPKDCIFAYWFRFRAMAFTTSSMTMGFDKCPFMPASKDACTSSAKALAVMAIMGISTASGRFGRLRMALVAS